VGRADYLTAAFLCMPHRPATERVPQIKSSPLWGGFRRGILSLSFMMTEPESDPVALYLARVESRLAADNRLTPLSAGILAAAELGIASDSIAFARALGVSHALVLREIEALEQDFGLVRVISRNARTQRTLYALPVAMQPGASTSTHD